MNEKEINDLTNLGYSMPQISQIMKFEECGIPVKIIFNKIYSEVSSLKDADDFRTFRNIVGKLDIKPAQKELYLKAFLESLDYNKPIVANMHDNISEWILGVMLEIKRRNLDVNIEPLFNNTYSLDFSKRIWYDILDGIDVNIYLNSKLSSKKKDILRTALKEGVNIESDLLQFSFLTEKDIDNLKILINNKYDYKSILKKMKDTKKTVLICEMENKNKISLFPFVNSGMSYDVINEIGKMIIDGKDVSLLKSIKISNVEEIPLYLEIHKLGYPLKKCKNYGAKTLSYIIEGLNLGLKETQIDEIIALKYTTTIPIYLDCHRYKQTEYIDFIKEHESFFMLEYEDDIRRLLKYNFENEDKNFNLLDLLKNDGKIIDNSLFSFYIELIIDFGVDKEFFYILKNGNYSRSQSKIIISAKKAGYDISCMLDNRLSEEQLFSIKNCMDLGLVITKTKEYDLPEKKNSTKNSCKIKYSGNDSYYYEYIDIDGNKYLEMINNKWKW